jgi:hypothetical protein
MNGIQQRSPDQRLYLQQLQTQGSALNPNASFPDMYGKDLGIINGTEHRSFEQGGKLQQQPQNPDNGVGHGQAVGHPTIRLQNVDNRFGQISPAEHPLLKRQNANNQVPGGPGKLTINANTRLLNRQGNPDESSASTQASPVHWRHDTISPLDTQAPGLPQAQEMNLANPCRGSVSLPSDGAGRGRASSASNGNMQTGHIILEMTDEARGMAEVTFGEKLPQPTDIPRVPESFNNIYSDDPFASSPAGRSDPQHVPEKFTTSGGPPTSEHASSELGHIRGSSSQVDSSTSTPKPHKRVVETPRQTPRQWASLPESFLRQTTSSSDYSQSNGVFGQVDEDKRLRILVNSALDDAPTPIATPPGNSDLSVGDQQSSFSSTPRPATNTGTKDMVSQGTSNAHMAPPYQPPARAASPETIKHALEQRHEDGLAGVTDLSEDIRRTSLAAGILARMSHSLNKGAPGPALTAQRPMAAPDYKDLALARIKPANENAKHGPEACSWCQFEVDFGLSNDDCMLEAKAFGSYCGDCYGTQNRFSQEYPVTRWDHNKTNEEKIKILSMIKQLEGQARFPPMYEAIHRMGAPTVAQAESQASILPQNTKSVNDGKDVSRWRGIMTCRGSPYGQIDVKKVRICHKCRVEKFYTIKHDKHTDFTPISPEEPRDPHNRRCMVCNQHGSDKCASANCPLRLCETCQVILVSQCKSICNAGVRRANSKDRQGLFGQFVLSL